MEGNRLKKIIGATALVVLLTVAVVQTLTVQKQKQTLDLVEQEFVNMFHEVEGVDLSIFEVLVQDQTLRKKVLNELKIDESTKRELVSVLDQKNNGMIDTHQLEELMNNQVLKDALFHRILSDQSLRKEFLPKWEEYIHQEESEIVSAEIGVGYPLDKPAPLFTLPTLSGQPISLEQLKGKRIIINFWATWCPPCKAEMPELQAFYKEKPADVELLAINIDQVGDVPEFLAQYDITFPVLIDHEEKVQKDYQILSIPMTYFIDKDGIVRHKHLGAMTKEDLHAWTHP
jgi:thiol-disulfide isomerase/thioredoxin